MESNISKELNGKFDPIALVKTDKKPKDAIGPKSKRGGCIMGFIAKVIADRVTAVFEEDTCSCNGAITGLGFGNGFEVEDPGIEIYSAFLSHGMEVAKDKEKYQAFCDSKVSKMRPMFEQGERVFAGYDLAYNYFTKTCPIFNNKEKYVVFKPLENLNDNEIPSSVIFTINPLELSALLTFDASLRENLNYTMTPQSSACQSIGSFVFNESEKDDPHGVLGLLDLAGKVNVKRWISEEYFTYAVPWDLFLKLEEKSHDSFLTGTVWKMMK